MSEENAITDPVEMLEDVDIAQRPESLEEFVGQQELVNQLRILVRGAQSRREVAEHILFSGPPGLGKTTLAGIVSKEQGSNLRTAMAPSLTRQADLVGILMGLEANDVLFLDEIHRLPMAVSETLNSAMEDRKLSLAIGEGAQARTHEIPLKPFTLVGATTRPGSLATPFLDRFGLHLRLDFYSDEDLASILERSAEKMGLRGTKEAWLVLAAAGRGTPRVAKRLLRRARDHMQNAGKTELGRDEALAALDSVGVSQDGLDKMDRRYMALLRRLGGGPVGLKALSAGLFEGQDFLETSVEPLLLHRGLVVRTLRGRSLTPIGLARTSRDV